MGVVEYQVCTLLITAWKATQWMKGWWRLVDDGTMGDDGSGTDALLPYEVYPFSKNSFFHRIGHCSDTVSHKSPFQPSLNCLQPSRRTSSCFHLPVLQLPFLQLPSHFLYNCTTCYFRVAGAVCLTLHFHIHFSLPSASAIRALG